MTSSTFVLPALWISVIACALGCKGPSDASIVENESTGRADFVVLASCDTSGWIEPCGCASGQSGGLSRRATLAKQLSGDHEMLMMSAGGAGSGDMPYDVEKLRAILDGEAAMGYEIHNIGTPELLAELPTHPKLTFLSTNVSGFKSNVVPSVVVQKSGWKLLVLGVVSPALAGPQDHFSIRSPEQAILQAIDANPVVDAVILLAYMDREALLALAAKLPEIDLIIGGHTGQSVAPIQIGPALVTAVSNQGKFIARVSATSSRGGDPSLRWSADLHEVSDSLAEDPSQAANLTVFRKRLEQFDFAADQTSFVADRISQPGDPNRFIGSQACQACHEADFATWQASAHSHAWDTLEQAFAHVDSSCQRCHTTGYGLTGGFVKRTAKDAMQRVDVGCESCHGPSSLHVANTSVSTPWQAADTCLVCHDHENSPQFQYDSYWAQIAHGNQEQENEN